MKIAVFAGTFDPLTKGHEYVIEKASELFDRLIVALCINAEKTPIFSVETRLEMLNAISQKYQNVEVVYHEGFVVDLMKAKKAKYSVRGVRNNTDYNYENHMHSINKKLYKDIETIFIPCDENLKGVSSTVARKSIEKGVIPHDYLSKTVAQIIEKDLKDRLK